MTREHGPGYTRTIFLPTRGSVPLPAPGVHHGAGLTVGTDCRKLLGRAPPAAGPWRVVHRVGGRALTMLFVGAGWLLFFSPVPDAWRMFRLLFRA